MGALCSKLSEPDSGLEEKKADADIVSIMCLGDSHTHGWHIPGGYRIHLWELMQRASWKVRFVGNLKHGPKTMDRRHEGWPGYNIQELLYGRGEDVDVNLLRDLQKYAPDIILLLVGTNDVIQEYDLGNFGHRYVTLMDLIQSQLPDVKVLFGTLPHIRGMEAFVDTANEQLIEVEKAAIKCGLRASLIDLNSILGPRDFHDSAHLNIRGFNKVAQEFFEALEEQDLVPIGSKVQRRRSGGTEEWQDSAEDECDEDGDVPEDSAEDECDEDGDVPEVTTP
jgi:lysophospholipase L1-like esterase